MPMNDIFSATINTLEKEGYVVCFRLDEKMLVCEELHIELQNYTIDKIFCFEDPVQNPSVLYAISAEEDIKGLLIMSSRSDVGVVATELATKKLIQFPDSSP